MLGSWYTDDQGMSPSHLGRVASFFFNKVVLYKIDLYNLLFLALVFTFKVCILTSFNIQYKHTTNRIPKN